jgi:hypothetical protein
MSGEALDRGYLTRKVTSFLSESEKADLETLRAKLHTLPEPVDAARGSEPAKKRH